MCVDYNAESPFRSLITCRIPWNGSWDFELSVKPYEGVLGEFDAARVHFLHIRVVVKILPLCSNRQLSRFVGRHVFTPALLRIECHTRESVGL